MRQLNLVLLAILVLRAMTVSATAVEATPASPVEQVADCMHAAATALGFSGTAHAGFGDREVEQSFGTSDPVGSVPNTPETRFNIGSVNKFIVAVAIGRLVDRGAVSFDAPIGRYLPDLKPAFAGITIAELLDHTSGLGDYFRPANRTAIEAAKTATDLLPLALAAPSAFPPGARRAYSNSGYVVLGAVIERVTHRPWTAFVQTEILDPAGMADTRFDSVGGATPLTRLSPSGKLDKPMPAPGPVLASPAGGMFSTAKDLSRLMAAVFDGRLLRAATLAELETPRPDPAGGPGAVGFGLVIRERPTRKLGLGGGAPGVNADLSYLPGAGWRLVALANVDPPTATQLDQVLERAVSSDDIPGACAAALADPTLRTPPVVLIAPGGRSPA